MALARGVLQEFTRHPGPSKSRVIVDGTGRPYTLQVAAEKIVPNHTSVSTLTERNVADVQIIGGSVAPVDSTVYEEDPVVWMRPRLPTGATIPTIIPFTALKSGLQAWGTLRPHDKNTDLTAPFTAGDFVSRARTWADDSRRTQQLVVDYFKDDGTKVQVTLAMSQSDEQSGEQPQQGDPQSRQPNAPANPNPMKISSILHD